MIMGECLFSGNEKWNDPYKQPPLVSFEGIPRFIPQNSGSKLWIQIPILRQTHVAYQRRTSERQCQQMLVTPLNMGGQKSVASFLVNRLKQLSSRQEASDPWTLNPTRGHWVSRNEMGS